jgi:restriction endonuclease Mrr
LDAIKLRFQEVISMQFKDAAYEILKHAGEPLHYNEITDRALDQHILTTAGQTPHATMGSRLYTDTLREDSLFRRAGKKGYFAIKEKPSPDIVQQIDALNEQVNKKLRKLIHDMAPQEFEELIGELLIALGVEEGSVHVTKFSGDGGIDVRGKMLANGITEINIAVQAKRWKGNVGAKIVRELRGSLKVHEQGIVITPSDFTKAARAEAHEPGKTHISLINGEELVDLMIKHKVGAYEEKYAVIYLDEERWQELLKPLKPTKKDSDRKTVEKVTMHFPILLQANYKEQVFHAQLLNIEGMMLYNGQEYATPTSAAKATGIPWKEVNGWDFWKYKTSESEPWKKIGDLR